MVKFLLIFLMVIALMPITSAKGVYQTSKQFIEHALNTEVPKAKTLWLTAEDKSQIAEILSHKFNLLRIRYWQQHNETVWIIDEIGKEKPITIGVHIKDQHIVELKVLAFRETRGDEVRHDFFTAQFNLAKLTQDNRLDSHIDGITGATLSVRALTKVARLALWLNVKAAIPV